MSCTEKNNISTVLPLLQHKALIITDIKNAVNAGKVVTISQAAISQNGLTVVGYSIVDPQTGAEAYLIGGGADGAIILFTAAFLIMFLTFELFESLGIATLAGASPVAIGFFQAMTLISLSLVAAGFFLLEGEAVKCKNALLSAYGLVSLITGVTGVGGAAGAFVGLLAAFGVAEVDGEITPLFGICNAQ